jgi:hypothetical protein
MGAVPGISVTSGHFRLIRSCFFYIYLLSDDLNQICIAGTSYMPFTIILNTQEAAIFFSHIGVRSCHMTFRF